MASFSTGQSCKLFCSTYAISFYGRFSRNASLNYYFEPCSLRHLPSWYSKPTAACVQVAKTPLQSVGSSISSFYPPRLARAAVTAVSLPSVKDDSKESSVKEPPTMSGEAPAAAAAPRRSRKRKLLLPANTRKINREAQQRFRLKQKVGKPLSSPTHD